LDRSHSDPPFRLPPAALFRWSVNAGRHLDRYALYMESVAEESCLRRNRHG
jgi:hypothetical protein